MSDDLQRSARALVLSSAWLHTVDTAPEAAGGIHRLAMLVHNVILHEVPLENRSCRKIPGLMPAEDEVFFKTICEASIDIVPVVSQFISAENTGMEWDAYDLVDGHIFFSVLQALRLCLKNSDKPPPSNLDGILKWLKGTNLSDLSDAAPADDTRKNGQPSVLKFEHPVFSKFLGEINLNAVNESQTSRNRIFEELTHWHNHKRTLVTKKPPVALDSKAMRRNQWLMADIMAYSASLTGANGKILAPETIIIGASQPSSSAPTATAGSSAQAPKSKMVPPKASEAKAKGNKKTQGVGGKQKAQNEAKRIFDESSKKKELEIATAWKETCHSLEKEAKITDRFHKSHKFLANLKKEQRKVVEAEVRLYICNVLAQLWTAYCKKLQPSQCKYYMAA